MEPASIRYNNPGAMWGGSALARKWGATKTISLNDGLGQGNNIAVFPSKVRGAAAQFDLWHTSGYYHNKTLWSAISKWSGGNWVASYTKFLKDRVPGLTNETVISDPYMASEKGILFVKAQAWHEAGKPYPLADEGWREAQKLVHGPNAVKVPNAKSAVKTQGAGHVVTQTAAHTAGLSFGTALAIFVVVAVVAFIGYKIYQSRQQKKLEAQIVAAEAALAQAKAETPASDVTPPPEGGGHP